MLDTLPGWTIHVPGHPGEVDGLLRRAVAGVGNLYIRLSDRASRTCAVEGAAAISRGSAGAPLLLAIGPLLDPATEAAAGLDVTICHLTTIRPFPSELVAALATRDVVRVEPYLAGRLHTR